MHALGVFVVGFDIALICVFTAMVHMSGASLFKVGLTALLLSLWLLLFAFLAVGGVFEARADLQFPLVGPGIVIPTIVGLSLLLKWNGLKTTIDSIPLHWLVHFQVFRIIGLLFIILYMQGQLPAEFAIPAGVGDIAIGLTALWVGWMVANKKPFWGKTAAIWSLLGIVDLVWAVSLGFRTSPGKLQTMALDSPNYMISSYPLVLIPVFVVPFAIFLHIAALIRLRRAWQSL